MSEAGPVKRFLMRSFVPTLALALIRLLDWSWRYTELDRERLERCRAAGRPVVAAFLHGRTFVLLRAMSRRRNGRWLSMCSKSLDGEAMARIEERLGLEVVRGSSGTDGLEAIVEMIRRVRRDPDLGACLAVDGSRGPRGRVQGGVISLAQRTGGMLIPVTASARPAHIFERAWDRTLLPWPFARVVIAYGEPMEVPARLRGGEAGALRAELERAMIALQAEADRVSGFADPLGVAAATAD